MYWLMLLAGIALPIMTSAQSRFHELEADYAQGYEHADRTRTDWPWMAPEQSPTADVTPEYRFRGDPAPSAGGTQSTDPDSELRFRPLTPRERERLGPITRWRPMDEERRDGPLERPGRSTLFDTLTPDRTPPPDPWDWPR